MTTEELQRELEKLREENARLLEENAELCEMHAQMQRTIAEAKDISPVKHPTFKRVANLAARALLSLRKVAKGWEVSLGHLRRTFRRLKDIWNILLQESWSVHGDMFPPPAEPKSYYPKCSLEANPKLKPKLKPRNASKVPSAAPEAAPCEEVVLVPF